MLRTLFGEQPRKVEGKLDEVFREIERFVTLMNKRITSGADRSHKLRIYEIEALGLLASLDELEQSCYAARGYAARVSKPSLARMSKAERLDYFRYVYFDKNAFIRVFAILDKLGAFLNDALELETEKIKPQFSYFTVLRGMRQRRLHPALSLVLDELKEKYKQPLAMLRKRRNVEVHYMNSEMMDDLKHNHAAYGQEAKLEDIAGQVDDLEQALEMVMESLSLSFQYVRKALSR